MTCGRFTRQESDSFHNAIALDETMKGVAAGGAKGVASGGEESQHPQRVFWLGEGGAGPALTPPTSSTTGGGSSGSGEVPGKNRVEVGESCLQEVLHGFVGDKLDEDIVQLSLPGGERGGEGSVVVVGRPAR